MQLFEEWLIHSGNADVAELLIKNGANFKVVEADVDGEGQPPLHQAAEKGEIQEKKHR